MEREWDGGWKCECLLRGGGGNGGRWREKGGRGMFGVEGDGGDVW